MRRLHIFSLLERKERAPMKRHLVLASMKAMFFVILGCVLLAFASSALAQGGAPPSASSGPTATPPTPAANDPIIGLPPVSDNGNCFPFGCAYNGYYQQVYSSSQFSTPVSITEISFYNTQYNNGGTEMNSGTWTISLSTTSATPSNLSSTFTANIGPDNTQVFSGNLVQSWAFGDTLSIPLTTPFTYNPNMGNLLMTVVASGTTSPDGLCVQDEQLVPGNCIYFDVGSSPETPIMARAICLETEGAGVACGNTAEEVDPGFGLVTGFTTTNISFVGPMVPTPPNGTSTVVSAANAPVTTSVTLPANTTDGDVAFLQDFQTPYPPATYNALFFPPACTPATTSNGVCNGTANTFSGGSIVPSSVECFAINGSCIDELIACFNSSQQRVRCDIGGIVPPAGTKIALSMQFTTPTGFHNPAMLIASDCFSLNNCPASPHDWANITDTSFQPGDTCTKPPCKGGGGTGSLNSELVMADLNLSCQVLNYSLSPTSGGPGTKVTITGSLSGCNSIVPGETSLFGIFLTGQLIFTFNGPTGSSCTFESVASPALPLIVPLNANLPFQFQAKVPPNACAGTFEVTSSIQSGTVSYVNSATFTVP